jgi:hypothetical protein
MTGGNCPRLRATRFGGVNICCGSEAAKVTLIERMAAFSQEAELNRACPSVLICSRFGQERPFSYFKKGPIDRLVNRRHNEENSR